MTFFKVISDNGQILFVEKTEAPNYVCRQKTHNIIIGCKKKEAEGVVIDHGENVLCVLDGKTLIGYSNDETIPVAVEISELEYEEYTRAQEQIDPEDESPQILEEMPAETVMTRAELTQRIEFLEDCLLEMSKVIYDD